MSNLHAYFTLRNQQGFSKALEGSRSHNSQSSGPTLSSSGGKSWTRTNAVSYVQLIDVNAKDWLGRTVLHLACAVTEPFALPYVRLLLAHPSLNVNIQDAESRWTALHRALYVGNIAACQLLLQRSDIDLQLRDNEGFTAFDLYNSTIDGTELPMEPRQHSWNTLRSRHVCDLLTWGKNRNAALGHGDGDDRAYPDQVVLKKLEIQGTSSSEKLIPVKVIGVNMGKLHTAVVTDEQHSNLRICGFGSGGRLGLGRHTQYNLLPVAQFNHHVVAVALGQDHTLVLTSNGEVLSWGLNRFFQLGYVVEPAASTASLHGRGTGEPIQTVARRVVGPLRRERVIGVAACKVASACWTSNDVFTWGTNVGQLGYDKTAQPVQVLPRKVTGVQAITDLAMTDNAMACLLNTKDVICFTNDTRFRVKFPTHEPSDLPRYVHPFVIKPPIAKVTSCESAFAALSSRGDVYTFTVPQPSAESTTDKHGHSIVTPQRVWPLRKFSPATDVSLGSDGEVVLCTESGHVYVWSRSSKGAIGGKTLKFNRVPFLHRALKVCVNSTGAFAALRLNYTPKQVSVSRSSLIDNIKTVRPWMKFKTTLSLTPTLELDDKADGRLQTDISNAYRLCSLLISEKFARKTAGQSLFQESGGALCGADMILHANLDVPVHRVLLAARSTALRNLMEGNCSALEDSRISIKYFPKRIGFSRLLVTGCHPITVLLILEYLYSDDIPALWDCRLKVLCSDVFMRLKVNVAQVRAELISLSHLLNLSTLTGELSTSVKRTSVPTLDADMERLLHDSFLLSSSAVKPDVFLELADRRVGCHSVILRARSMFFQSFFEDDDWTINRWDSDGTITVDMKHFEWRAMSFIMIWLYSGKGLDLFDNLDSVESVHDLLDLVFEVMAVASELLLNELMLICSAIILRHVTLNNVVSILADATHYNALALVDSLQDYIASNLEAIMESHLLDDLQPDLVRSLSTFIFHCQAEKSPVMRSNLIAETALRTASSWLKLQDIPQPLVRSHRTANDPRKVHPITSEKVILPRRATLPVGMPMSGPPLHFHCISPPHSPRPTQDDIFHMEDVTSDMIPALHINKPREPIATYTVPGRAWKTNTVFVPPKTDMKAIMAETAVSQTTPSNRGGQPGTNMASVSVPEASSVQSKRSQKPLQRRRPRVDHQSSEVTAQPADRGTSLVFSSKPPGRQRTVAENPVSASPRSPQLVSSSSSASLSISNPQPPTPIPIFYASARAVHRRNHNNTPAWTSNLGQELPPVTGLSFIDIQLQQERDRGQGPKTKKPLREIQEEEKVKQAEEDFLKWWTAEESRLKVEMESRSARPSPKHE